MLLINTSRATCLQPKKPSYTEITRQIKIQKMDNRIHTCSPLRVNFLCSTKPVCSDGVIMAPYTVKPV